jgi:hypothetical protein
MYRLVSGRSLASQLKRAQPMDFIATGFSPKAAYLASADRRGPNEHKAAPRIYLIPKGYRKFIRDMTMLEQAATDT